MLLAKHVISAYYGCIAVFNGISEVFVNCILKIVYGYSGGICMLWAWFGGLDVLVDVVYRFEGKRQHNYKSYCG